MRIDELAYKTVFKKRRLIPVAVQDYATRQVLMVAYADAKAVKETVRTGFAHYWSRSRQELWKKGQTSGNVQRIIEILVDCDGDALLYRVEQTGTACHTGKGSCFHRCLKESARVRRKFEIATIKQIVQAYSRSRVVERKWHGRGVRASYRYIVNPLTENIPPPHPLWSEWIAEMIHKQTSDDIDKVITAESLGLPIAQQVASLKGKPLAVVRKRNFHDPSNLLAKVRYTSGFEDGTYWIYGVSKGDKVLIVDDAISTGGTLAPLISVLQQRGVTVTDVLCVLEKPEYHGVRYVRQATGFDVKTMFRVDTRSRECLPTRYTHSTCNASLCSRTA
jgi:phosphoribosyl-AMP cyclohydrolase/adenine/guanine phosphoribosyltransferase-like PRPP-binding protein